MQPLTALQSTNNYELIFQFFKSLKVFEMAIGQEAEKHIDHRFASVFPEQTIY